MLHFNQMAKQNTDTMDIVQTSNLFPPPNIFNVKGQTDVAVVSPRYTGGTWKSGVFIGIEMATHIVQHSFIQAQAECLILSYNSAMPVIQVRRVSIRFQHKQILTFSCSF